MAVDTNASKRKIDADSNRKTKKVKKTQDVPVADTTPEIKTTKTKVTKVIKEPAAPQASSEGTRKSTRKRAADFFVNEVPAVAPVPAPVLKKAKTAKAEVVTKQTTVTKSETGQTTTVKFEKKVTKREAKPKKVEAKPKEDVKPKTPEAKPKEDVKPKKAEAKPKKSEAKPKKDSKPAKAVEEAPEEAEEEVEEEELDDQTAALLKGFESSSDDEEELVIDEPAAIENVPAAPSSKALQKKLKAAGENTEERGVVYIGRIPHGFYEHQMRAYFSQFGDITRLRLSRNKKTGQSKHYAFLEFASADVAKIVADTMDKYLMFNHILQVRTIPKESVHANLFAGANSRFRAVPRNKLAAKHLRQPLHKEGWEKRISKEAKRREQKMAQLKEMGYEFKAPAIKGV